jgi:hypothetical protein
VTSIIVGVEAEQVRVQYAEKNFTANGQDPGKRADKVRIRQQKTRLHGRVRGGHARQKTTDL